MLPLSHPDRIEPDSPRPRRSSHPSRPSATEVLRYGERYADLRDQHLAHTLILEDAREEREEISAHERITCHVHRRWAHECIASPMHVIPVTGTAGAAPARPRHPSRSTR